MCTKQRFYFTVLVVNETTRRIEFGCECDLAERPPTLKLTEGKLTVPPLHCIHLLVPAQPEWLVRSDVSLVKVWDDVPTLVTMFEEGTVERCMEFVSYGQGLCFTDAEDGERVVRLTFPLVMNDVVWFRNAFLGEAA